jgi:signal transduction histidine kinase
MAEMLGDDPELTNEQQDYVNSIQLSAKALLTIVNDILDFSKLKAVIWTSKRCLSTWLQSLANFASY